MEEPSNPAERNLLSRIAEKPVVLGLLLAAITLLLYAPVLEHQFLEYDDNAYITNNVHVRTGLSSANALDLQFNSLQKD
jgi:uncharacterized membrane protein YdfJ with MMPL/SSD domain